MIILIKFKAVLEIYDFLAFALIESLVGHCEIYVCFKCMVVITYTDKIIVLNTYQCNYNSHLSTLQNEV